MGMSRTTITALLGTVLATSGAAWAQNSADTRDDRPAITTYWGDTGLWFVPTAEVIKSKGWAFGVYRTEQDYKQGRSDVAFYPLTFAIGAEPSNSSAPLVL